jgi:RND family efflux transporter MFP subunit
MEPMPTCLLPGAARHLRGGAALAALAIVGACSRPAPPPEPVRAVRTMVVQEGVAGGFHDYAADVRPRTESRLAFRTGGKLVRRAVELGQTVRKGQVLAELDAQDLRLSQRAADSAVEAARVNAALAQSDFQRFKELREQGFIGAAELERRRTTLEAAQAQLEQARAQAGVQGNQARYSVLVADAPGVVTGVDAEPGAVVAAGTPVLRVALDGPRDAVFAVPEDRVQAVRDLLGRPGALKVTPWGTPAAWAGTVREVAAAADPATRTFLVKADLGRADVRLGQTLTVRVEQAALPGVVKLPLTAVLEQQGRTAVWLVDRTTMSVKPQVIAVAGADHNEVVAASGLQAGQLVVTAGVHTLTAGQKVRLYAAGAGAAAASGPASAARR